MNPSRNHHPPASPAVKEKLISQIRDEGLSVTDASRQSGYSTKTIYAWLRTGVEATGTSTNLILENNRLKKELEQAYALLGRATATMNRSKD
jgi:transposase-like protein